MSTPLFAEDSNAVALAPILAKTIEKLDENANKYDYIMAFFIAVMSEKGYRVSCLYDEDSDTWRKEMTMIPSGWQNGDQNPYEIDFLHHKISYVGIRLIGIPVGDWIVLNLMSKEGYRSIKTRSVAVNVPKYVNMHHQELGKFWNLKELALKFKNRLLAPLHAEIMIEMGMVSPSLMGIPEEIKDNISKMLDEESRKNLEMSCKSKKE